VETSSHILWHEKITMRKKKSIIMKAFKELGPGILFDQFLFLDFPLRWFLVGPTNLTFILHPRNDPLFKIDIFIYRFTSY
jgi:hypothetical protein